VSGPALSDRAVRLPQFVHDDQQAAIAAALPYGRLEVFERSDHYPFLEEPEHFTAVVAAFLSSVPG
jgi:pimeloyl-ACP methyl ester carboxylesterase